MNSKNKNNEKFLKILKKHFIIATVIFLLFNWGVSIYIFGYQFLISSGTGYEAVYLASALIPPIITFLISLKIIPKTYEKLDRFFWAVLLAFIGMLIFTSINQVLILFPTFNGGFGFWFFNDFYLGLLAMTAISYIPTIIYLFYASRLLRNK